MALFMHLIQKIFGPNYFFQSDLNVPPSVFIQNMSQAPSKCLKQKDKRQSGYIRLFQKRIIAFKKFFLFWVPMNIQKDWKSKLESAYSYVKIF